VTEAIDTRALAGKQARRDRKGLSSDQVERLMSVASPLVLLLIWELAAQFHFIDVRFFPAPSKIFGTLFTMAENGLLWKHFWASMQRLFWGFLFGGIPALALGMAMGLNKTLRAIFDPIVASTYPIPKSAILPLILLIFGLGEGSKIVMVAIGIFYPILINSMAGVLEINKIYFDVSRNFGADRWQVFRTVALPGALPLIMTGVKLGVGMGLILIAIAEMVGAKSGLGYMIWNAWEILSVETMYVGLIVIAVLGLVLSMIVTEVERYLVPWKRR
jgi:ABC-type nitrate/sulfonate/bicarbonate transport system permease component